MKWLLVLAGLVTVIIIIIVNEQPARQPTADQQTSPAQMSPQEAAAAQLAAQRAANKKLPWDKRGEAITPGGPLIREWTESRIAADLYNHDFKLEFEPGGQPFETTQASRIANRNYRVAVISAMKAAAARQDKQIAADINLAQVADDVGTVDDKSAAIDKLFLDLKKLPKPNDPSVYDLESPWGKIIANLESQLAYDDESERKEKAGADALSRAKAAAEANQ